MRIALLSFALTLTAAAQTTPVFRVELPLSVASEQVYLEYCIYGPGIYCSYISPQPHLTAYTIDTNFRGRRADSLKGVLYIPGCAVDKFTIEPQHFSHVFECRPLPTVTLAGEVFVESSLYGKQVDLHATYMATWAKDFFGTDDAITDFTIGGPVNMGPGNRFQFTLPDFASDPVTASGSLYIWAKEKGTGNLVALLVPAGKEKRINSLKVQSHYPATQVFEPCTVNASPLHDKTGFAIRGEEHACFK